MSAEQIKIQANRIRTLENDLYHANSTINSLAMTNKWLSVEIRNFDQLVEERDCLRERVIWYDQTDEKAAQRRYEVETRSLDLDVREFWVNFYGAVLFLIYCGLFAWVMCHG